MAATAAAKLGGKIEGADAVNPFALNLDRVSKTDPKLIKYEEVSRFPYPDAEPHRIRLGADKNLYIPSAKQVTILDVSGTVLRTIPVSAPARCVSPGPDGAIFVGFRDHVEVFDVRGEQRASWESCGPRAWISGMAVGENDVFVADAGNRVVLRYDKSGKVRGRIGEKNKERNVPGLIVPSPYLEWIGQDGLLRVNNPGRHRVEVYTADGDLEFSWGKPSAGIEGFCGCCNPISAWRCCRTGGYVTCEKGLPRVKVYSARGRLRMRRGGAGILSGKRQSGRGSSRGRRTAGWADWMRRWIRSGRIYILDLVAGDVRVMKRKA